METSRSGETSSSLQDFLRAFEPSNRVFPAAHRSLMGGWWTSYAFAARIGDFPFAQMRHQQGTPCSPTPRGRMAHRHRTRHSWDGLSGYLAWVYTLRGREGDAEQGTGDAGVRGEAADGARGFARHPRFSCGDCDRRREHHFRRRPGLADAAHSSRGRRQCWRRHRYFRAFDRAAAGGDSRPGGVVQDPPGRAGHHGAGAVPKSPKDGYTAYMMSNAHAISAAMYKSLRYDPVNDFQMVSMLSMVATAGLVLVAAPAFPAGDLAGVLAAVRANPGKFNFGSAGVGTTQHFAGELMKQTAGLDI